jgi:hypothetical protein
VAKHANGDEAFGAVYAESVILSYRLEVAALGTASNLVLNAPYFLHGPSWIQIAWAFSASQLFG